MADSSLNPNRFSLHLVFSQRNSSLLAPVFLPLGFPGVGASAGNCLSREKLRSHLTTRGRNKAFSSTEHSCFRIHNPYTALKCPRSLFHECVQPVEAETASLGNLPPYESFLPLDSFWNTLFKAFFVVNRHQKHHSIFAAHLVLAIPTELGQHFSGKAQMIHIRVASQMSPS